MGRSANVLIGEWPEGSPIVKVGYSHLDGCIVATTQDGKKYRAFKVNNLLGWDVLPLRQQRSQRAPEPTTKPADYVLLLCEEI